MDLRNLEYIVAIAAESSISRAAEKLYLSQPALSKSLAVFEKNLGVQFFNRENEKLQITPAGKIYIKAAEEMLRERNSVVEQLLHGKQAQNDRPIKIAVNNSPAIVKFTSKLVELQYDTMPIFLEIDSAIATQQLLEGQIDIASLSLPNGVPDGIVCVQESTDSLAVVVPNTPKFDYINKVYTDTLPASALDGADAVMPRAESGIGIIINNYLEDNNIRLNCVYSISVVSAITVAVERGVGIALMHKSMTSNNSLYSVYTPEPRLEYRHSLCLKENKEPSAAIKKILKTLWGVEI